MYTRGAGGVFYPALTAASPTRGPSHPAHQRDMSPPAAERPADALPTPSPAAPLCIASSSTPDPFFDPPHAPPSLARGFGRMGCVMAARPFLRARPTRTAAPSTDAAAPKSADACRFAASEFAAAASSGAVVSTQTGPAIWRYFAGASSSTLGVFIRARAVHRAATRALDWLNDPKASPSRGGVFV